MAIFKREARAFFGSAQAPVITAGFLVLTGLFYYLFVRGYADASLATVRSGRAVYLNIHAGIFHKLYGDVVLFLVFLVPAVTMRLLSAEYRSGRYDLIISWPVSERNWVLGKWLSAVAVVATLLLGTAFYFGLTVVLGGLTDPPTTVEIQPLLTSLLGLMLLGGAVAAIGLFASALLSHQAAAYFLGFALSLGLFLVGQLAIFLPGFLGTVAAELALGQHFLRFAGGVLDSRDIVYFLGLTAVGLAAAEAAFQQRRLHPRRRGRPWRTVLIVLLAAIFLQTVAVRRPLRVDVTSDRRFSLASQTEQILASLDRERPDPAGAGVLPPPSVEVLAFYQSLDGARQSVQALLTSISDASSRVHYEIIDPDTQPEMLMNYGVTVARTVIVSCDGRTTQLLEPDESQLASAIFRLATDTRPVVYWMLGHGEARIDLSESGGAEQLADLLAVAGYDVRPLVLPERLLLPADAAVVIWAGPKLDPDPTVLDLLDGYLETGGAMACFFGPDSPPALRAWTERHSIAQQNDVVIAPNRAGALAGVGLRTVTVVDGYGTHPAVRSLRAVATTFPLVQTLRHVADELPHIRGEVLLKTGPDTWCETDPDTRYSGNPRFDADEDRRGPLPFGVALTIDAPDTTSSDGPGRMVLIGSSAFVVNANIGLYGNRDLALNLIGWLAAEEDLLGLRGRRASFQPLLLENNTKEWLGWISVLGWPGLVGVGWWLLLLWSGRRGQPRRSPRED